MQPVHRIGVIGKFCAAEGANSELKDDLLRMGNQLLRV
jgi:hypothetical protein